MQNAESEKANLSNGAWASIRKSTSRLPGTMEQQRMSKDKLFKHLIPPSISPKSSPCTTGSVVMMSWQPIKVRQKHLNCDSCLSAWPKVCLSARSSRLCAPKAISKWDTSAGKLPSSNLKVEASSASWNVKLSCFRLCIAAILGDKRWSIRSKGRTSSKLRHNFSKPLGKFLKNPFKICFVMPAPKVNSTFFKEGLNQLDIKRQLSAREALDAFWMPQVEMLKLRKSGGILLESDLHIPSGMLVWWSPISCCSSLIQRFCWLLSNSGRQALAVHNKRKIGRPKKSTSHSSTTDTCTNVPGSIKRFLWRGSLAGCAALVLAGWMLCEFGRLLLFWREKTWRVHVRFTGVDVA